MAKEQGIAAYEAAKQFFIGVMNAGMQLSRMPHTSEMTQNWQCDYEFAQQQLKKYKKYAKYAK